MNVLNWNIKNINILGLPLIDFPIATNGSDYAGKVKSRAEHQQQFEKHSWQLDEPEDW